jgi:hypothetical protein
MSVECLADPANGPQWQGVLPGRPEPFVPDSPRMQAAAQQHDMRFEPEHQWPDV